MRAPAVIYVFFFQAEDGIRDLTVTGVQTCALPISGDVAAANRATELLIAAGHTRIAHIPGEAWQEVSADRLRGYRDALATADIPFDPTLVLEGNWQLNSGYEATLELMKHRRPPTAIFCGNDRMAIGCYEA